MKAKTAVNFHNRFDIEVRDAKTGTLKQQGFAENIVLNQMYTRICSFSTYFVSIHFGTGTGTLDPIRTSLFSHLGTKAAVDEEIIKAYPTSKWTRKITLNPEEYVGSTFTEVGVAYGSTTTNLVTHAMIKDSEGNPLTLTKTALDVLVIYATVYITFTDGDTVFANSAYRNTLVNYFTTHSSVSNTIGLGNYRNSDVSRKSMIHSSKSSTRTADTANKKVTFNTVRFGITEGNGPKNLAVLTNALSYDMGAHIGGTISNEVVGTGDGIKTEFQLTHSYPSNITVKVDGVTTTDYTMKQSVSIIEIKEVTTDGVASDNIMVRRSPRNKYIVSFASSGWQIPYYLDELSGEYLYYGSDTTGVDPFYGYTKSNIVLFCDDDSVRFVDGTVKKYNPATGNHETIQTISGAQRASRLSRDGRLLIAAKEANGFFIYKWNEVTQQFDNIQNIALDYAGGCDISQDNRRIVLGKAYGSGASVYDCQIHVYEYNDTTGLYERVQVITQSGNNNSKNIYVNLSPTAEFMFVHSYTACKAYIHNGTEYIETNYSYTHGVSSARDAIFTGERFFMVWVSGYDIAGYMFEINKSDNIINFNTPPAQDAVITADYHVPYIPKDENHVLDVSFELQFGEGI